MIPGAADVLGRTVDPNYTVATTHFTISPASALPNITAPLYLDGQTQAEFTAATTPIIELDGTAAGALVNGILFAAGSDGSTLRSFVINRYNDDAVEVTSDTITIIGNYLGTDVTGAIAQANGRSGITLINASNVTIGDGTAAGRNVLSGNTRSGVDLRTATNVVIEGNYIGLDPTGTVAVPNASGDAAILASTNFAFSTNVTIRANVISGNAGAGIEFEPSITGFHDNFTVVGNIIGLNAAGTAAIGNGSSGISFRKTTNLTIGGTAVADRNIISGNGSAGIGLGVDMVGASILGNYVGTDITGTTAFGNTGDGISVNTSSNTAIGDGTAAGRNIVSGNGVSGIGIYSATATGNIVSGNYIGTDVTGELAVANSAYGVLIQDAPTNTFGGTVAGARNIISGNGIAGIRLNGLTATGNLIQGNYIGTDKDGATPVPNVGNGILVFAPSNIIGGSVAGAGNVISGNGDDGIDLREDGSNTTIQGNLIGPDATGAFAIDPSTAPGGRDGLLVASENNIIGGLAAGEGNVISGNGLRGIAFFNDVANASGNLFQGNMVGTDLTGTNPLGNASAGVHFTLSATNNTASDNVIAFNTGAGIISNGLAADVLNNTFSRNSIFSNTLLGIDLIINGNPAGVTANDALDGRRRPQ